MRALAKPLAALAIALFLVGKFHGAIIHPGKHASSSIPGGSGHTSLSGTLNCSQLEQLWESAGGDPSQAKMAAAIAEAESGGRQYPPNNASMNSNGVTDVGYWQINAGFHPTLASYNPYKNARAAVILSNNGRDWSPWVTYQKGMELGLC